MRCEAQLRTCGDSCGMLGINAVVGTLWATRRALDGSIVTRENGRTSRGRALIMIDDGE